MIKIFSQYSYGGYKTFYIDGVQNEVLDYDKEVTLDTTHNFPQLAQVYFQYGGSKIVYRKFQTGELALVVREIPSNDVDSAGRPISCAVQFIGEEQDRQTLDNLALTIANDFVAFETFFSDLFYVRNGLHIEGDKLKTYLDNYNGKTVVVGDTHPVLSSIKKKHDGVFLFVPLSEKFGADKDVTNRVCNELKINQGELIDAVISLKELSRIQKRINIIVQPNETEPENPSENPTKELDLSCPNVNAEKDEHIAILEEKNRQLQAQIKQQANDNFEVLKKMQDDIEKKKDENQKLNKELSLYKKFSIGLGIASVLLAFSLIGSCSSEKKKVNTENKAKETAFSSINIVKQKEYNNHGTKTYQLKIH